jgi:GT2 family glycosyltransferase
VPRTATVQIVVVAYGKPELVISCVRSIRRHGGADIPVHVVDNNSPDDTADRVAEACPDVHLVR